MAIRCRLVGVLMVALESPVLVFLIFLFLDKRDQNVYKKHKE